MRLTWTRTDALDAHRLGDVIDLAGGHALDVALRDHAAQACSARRRASGIAGK
jgi:hypothetical protein